MKSPFEKKFCGKSPLKELTAKQEANLPEALKTAIEASPNNYGSPLNQFQENASVNKKSSVDVVQMPKIKNPNYDKLTQKQKDSLQKKAYDLGKVFYSKEFKVEVDPTGVLSKMDNPNYKK